MGAIAGVIKTIIELKNMLMGVLAKAATAIGKIIKDPIGFLNNLVHAVGAGLKLFLANIADHLKKGLVSWLLGTAVKAGLDLPSSFDLKGIIQLITSLLGLTWANIRARITSKGVPDQAVTAAEKSVPIAEKLSKEGPAGAEKEIVAEVGDLKATILGKLTELPDPHRHHRRHHLDPLPPQPGLRVRPRGEGDHRHRHLRRHPRRPSPRIRQLRPRRGDRHRQRRRSRQGHCMIEICLGSSCEAEGS